MQDCSVIAKGSYSDFRFNDFVSVRQYLLIREKGKKYLILKLLNDSTETVTGLKLAVEQVDVRGKCIATSHVEWNDVNGKAGEMFVPQDKIPLKENCMEVKINLVGAVYGDYTYSVKSNQLVVTYDKKQAKTDKDYSKNTDGEKVVVSERKFKGPHVLVMVAIAIMIMSIVGTALQLSIFKKNEDEFVWRGINYEFASRSKDDGAPIRVVGYTGLAKNIVIPKEIKGYPVTEIAPKAFYKEKTLRSIKIEAQVVLSQKAFEGCDNLKVVELDGVTVIGDNAFYSCDSLESVTARNLESIGTQAFADCKKLTYLDISNDDKELVIGTKAFLNCGNIETIILDQNVKYLSKMDIFSGVANVEELTLKNFNSAQFEDSTDKSIASLFDGTKQTALVKLTIKDIDAIPASFCEGLTNLESVMFGGLETDTISKRAFYGCENLTALDINMEEDAVITTVDDYAFYKTAISSFDGSALEKIGKYAFADNANLTGVVSSSNKNLEVLGEGAFKNCTALKSFHISALLPKIEDGTFEKCYALANVTIDNESELTAIGDSAFLDCESLANIKMPNTVVEIGENAYKNCKSAATLNLSRGLETIGNYAFSGCKSIKKVEIPDTVTRVGKGAFKFCSAIESFTAPFVGCSPQESRYFAAIFDGASYYDSSAVPESLKTITITGDYDIADGAFYGLNHIKQVYFTGSFVDIGYDAFMNCSNLRELRLSSSLRNIGSSAFANCYLLFEVFNDSSLALSRGSNNFGGVGYYALAVYEANSPRLEQAEKDGFKFLKAPEGWYLTDHVSDDVNWTLPRTFSAKSGEASSYIMVAHLFEGRKDVKELTVTSGVSSLGDFAFYGCYELEKVTFADDAQLTSIAEYTFASANKLKTLSLESDKLQTIGASAFSYCVSLESIDIGYNIKTIGGYAFAGCASITELHLGSNVERIGNGALSSMTNLADLTVPFIGETATSNNYMGYVFGLSPEDGYNLRALKKITVLSAPIVKERAFYGFQYLQEIQLPSATHEIQDYAFAYCYELKNFNFSGLQRIGDFAFTYTGIKSVSLPAQLIELGTGAFSYSGAQSLSLKNSSLKVIPDEAFTNCSSLTSVELSNASIQSIGNFAFYNTGIKQISFPASMKQIGASAFYNTHLTSLTIGGGINSLGDRAFAYCSSLKSVSITSSDLTKIPEGAFIYCTSLSDVDMTYGLREIGDSAFEYCAMAEITLPASVTTVRAYAFAYCWVLGSVKLSSNMELIDTGAFYGCDELYEVYNPSNLTVTRGSENHGGVATKAVIVHKSLNATKLVTTTAQGLVFKYAPTEGEACLFSYEGKITDLNVQSINLGGRVYSRYWVYANAFTGNNDLLSVNTGAAIEEIGQYAFAYCSNLKKVTVGSGLKSDKMSQYAFYECPNLWEVHDSNSNYNITKGGTGCGYVAYYAVALNQSITFKTQGSFEFMVFGGAWYLYAFNGSYSTELPEIGYTYSIFKHEKLSSTPFDRLSYRSYLVIPTAVTKIYPQALGSYVSTVYYMGTQSSWSSISANAGIGGISVYFYSQCVHNSYKGTAYWSYKSGVPSSADTVLSSTIVDATCKKDGSITYKCNTCKETLETVILEKVNHNYGANGKCTWCDRVSVQTGDLGSMVQIVNTSSYKYLIDSNKNIYSDWSNDYGQFTSNMTVRALEDIRIEFTVRCVLPSGASVSLYLNNGRFETFETSGTQRLTCDMSINDLLRFEIRNYSTSNSEARIYIENIVITKAVKE